MPHLYRRSALVVLLAIVAACASETGSELGRTRVGNQAEAVELAAPARGFQVETGGVVIDPGDDVRMCEVVVLPGEPSERYYVNRIQSALSSRGEDLIVRAAEPGSETASIMDHGASMPCTRAGEAFGEELSDVLASRGPRADERFAAGTGKLFFGGQKLAVEYHYVNDTNESAIAKAKLAFHVVDASQVHHLVRSARFENFTIYTPPNGHSSHLGECRVREELVVTDLARRTQRYGTTFKVWQVGGEQDGNLLWESTDRHQGRVSFAEPLHLLPGQGFRFQCDYANASDRELRYGVSAADETCTLDASFWTLDGDTGREDAVAEDCLLFNVDSDGIARSRS